MGSELTLRGATLQQGFATPPEPASLTNAPYPTLRMRTLSASKISSAQRRVPRPTPSSRARSPSFGNTAPGRHAPEAIRSIRTSRTWRCRGRVGNRLVLITRHPRLYPTPPANHTPCRGHDNRSVRCYANRQTCDAAVAQPAKGLRRIEIGWSQASTPGGRSPDCHRFVFDSSPGDCRPSPLTLRSPRTVCMVNACGNVVFDISALGVGMRAIHYLIDCEGRTLRSPFETLRPIIGRAVTEPALITHAIENLGYAHVLEWPQGLVVSYRRPVANAVTLAGAIYLLADLADKRVIFSVLDRHVRYALCRGRSQAIGRLAG